MKHLYGTQLNQEDQKHVLAAYVHRYTGDHKPQWADMYANKGVQFKDDQEWLRRTKFIVRKNGRLDMRHKHCYSNPTWPNNPEMHA
jgi:hypothetical protein